MYILLSGKPPFEGADDNEIMKKISIGTFSLSTKELKHVSKDGMDLLKKLLTYEPEKRISASEALLHPWIQKVREEVSISLIERSLTNLQQYNVENKL